MELYDLEYYIGKERIFAPVLMASLVTSIDTFIDIPIDYTALTTGKKFFTDKQEYAIKRSKFNYSPLPIEFNWGYAITTHKF